MYFETKGKIIHGFEEDDRYDKEIMDLPECDEWYFHSHCLLTFHNFENDEGEPRVEWVAHCLKDGNVGASIGSHADCVTGRAGAREDAEHEAEYLFREWEKSTT